MLPTVVPNFNPWEASHARNADKIGITHAVTDRIMVRELTGFAVFEASLGGKWLELLYRQSIRILPLPKTAACSPTESTS
jgi:hypothetical protein